MEKKDSSSGLRSTFIQTDKKVLMEHATYFSAHIEKFFCIPHVCDRLCTPSQVVPLPNCSLHLMLCVKLSENSSFSSEEEKRVWRSCCHICSRISSLFL